jgi:hypothetical protein
MYWIRAFKRPQERDAAITSPMGMLSTAACLPISKAQVSRVGPR